MADAVVAIDTLLTELGYGAPEDARRAARAALERAGLTNPRKHNISESKRAQVAEVLSSSLARVCDDPRCQEVAADDPRPHARVERAGCQVCEGSPNAGAARAMARALLAAGRPRLLVVGGSPNARAELDLLLAGTGVQAQLVDGTIAIPARRADAWSAGADVIAVWGGTMLDHRVSSHFMGPEYASKRVNPASRGIAALADAIRQHVRGGRAARS
jgi:hypothetical protein